MTFILSSLHHINRVFIKYCVFLNSASSAAALVFYLPGVCTHTDTEGKQRKARVRNIFENSDKNTIFNEHPVSKNKRGLTTWSLFKSLWVRCLSHLVLDAVHLYNINLSLCLSWHWHRHRRLLIHPPKIT